MPWKETSPMDQKLLFVADCARDLDPVAEVCRRYNVSRKTGYKWIDRFKQFGLEGLYERSRRPHHLVHSTPDDIIVEIKKARGLHPSWGAKKLLWLLKKRDPDTNWPPRSTVCDILKRNDLIPPQRSRRHVGHPGRPLTPMNAPNEIRTADFKGHFRTGDGYYCYPLTVEDGFSRFVLDIQAFLSPSHQLTRPVFERLFRAYGLPRIIRTDNGAPFASIAIGRLSQLSVWWIRLGIFPELIEPGHPEQNPRHERMHRTLKAETTRPPAHDHYAQQERFDTFRRYYNEERPHESLGQAPPASVYHPSDRSFPNRLPRIEYPGHFEVRRVARNGGVRWNSRWVCVTHVLAEEYVGFEEVDDGLWEVFFGQVRLGRFNERISKIEDDQGRKYRKKV